MLFRRLVETSAALAATRSRNAKADHLGALLADVQLDEIPIVVAYLGGEIPQGRIGLGYAAVSKVNVAPASSATLSVLDVDAALTRIAQLSGPGSQRARAEALGSLLSAATAPEQDFIRRLIVRELRQGALEGIMVEALASTTGIAAAAVRRAAMVSGDLPAVAAAALSGGAAALDQFRLTLFQPLQPMLAQTATDPAAATQRFNPVVVEAKLDGARIQVHKDGGRVEAYTRNLRNVTESIPEIVEAVLAFRADRLILDGEAIGMAPDGRPYPFQVTMSRFGRSTDIASQSNALPLSGIFFDILHRDGEDLIDVALSERIAHLDAVVDLRNQPQRRTVATTQDAEAFYRDVLDAGHEGVVFKDPASPYAAGRRGSAWLKLKPAHTVDLVVIAVEWGSGRRKGWLSNLHLGARDRASGELVMLGKTFKGLTDAMLEWQTERFLELETHRDGHIVYVRPEQVVEIAFDGIQASSRYPGGMALRFARVKGYRDDKSAAEADTVDAIRAIFEGRA